jgi:endoglucanase
MRLATAVLTMTVLLACRVPECPAGEPPGPPPLKVEGTHLTTPDGKVAPLRGLNLPTLEWGQGEHLFRSLDMAVDEWHVNFIRLTVSQDRWFGHTKEKKDGGAHYRQTVHEFVKRAAAKRCYVLLNLHFIDPGLWLDEDEAQKGQYVVWTHKMPDDHSVDFWASAAREFANDPAVLFDLYNEPGNVSWAVWRDGGNLVEKNKNAPGGQWEYHSPGMQKLVDTCRDQGAKNIVVAEGLNWGYDLSGVVKGFALKDPGGNGVAYSTHIYDGKGGPKDWELHVTPAVKKYAVLIGEFSPSGESSLERILGYADQYQLPWLAWCLHPSIKPCLIKNWKYEPTAYGEAVKKALADAAKR